MADVNYDITYSGWAPCAHDDEDTEPVRKWLEEITAEDPEGFGWTFRHSEEKRSKWPFVGGLMEDLIWAINDLGGNSTMYCDQWVGVSTIGAIYIDDAHKWTVATFIQADTFLLGLAETYRWWKAKKEELKRQVDEDAMESQQPRPGSE